MKKAFSLAKLGAAALLLTSLTSCEDVLEQYFPKKDQPTPGFNLDIPFYALSADNKLDAYSTSNPSRSMGSVSISGLQSGERIVGIDFRPATGQLYGISSGSRLYVINQKTGAARAIGSGPITPAVEGDMVGFDFNPTVDRIRVVTNTGQNLRLNPETATGSIVDGSINGVPGAGITGSGYTNSVAGTATTVLYALDPATNTLYRQDPPNAGTLVAVGDLKLDISGNGGFDIDPKTGTALGLYNVNGQSTLFTVSLSTGATQTITKFGNTSYIGLAIPTQAVAYTVSLFTAFDRVYHELRRFDPTAPTTNPDNGTVRIFGLGSNDIIFGLDFRPANGQLYALAQNSETKIGQLYTINAASGAATLVGPLSVPLTGNSFGFDFNPVVDRIRIVSNTGQNLRVNPADGVAIVDGNLKPGTPAIVAAAYANNFAGTTTTSLYTIDENTDKLYLQSPPNDGQLVEIGKLGVDLSGLLHSFDISGTTNTAYAILDANGGGEKLYKINLSTGVATVVQENASGGFVSGFTVGLGF